MKKVLILGLMVFILTLSLSLVAVGLSYVIQPTNNNELGVVGGRKEWVFDFTKNLVRSTTNTIQTLIAGDGTTSTTTNSALEVKGDLTVTNLTNCTHVTSTSLGIIKCGTASVINEWEINADGR